MNETLNHRMQKLTLWSAIRTLGAIHKEDPTWIEDYAKDVYTAWSERLDVAIACFEDLLKQAEWIKLGYSPQQAKRM